MAKKIVHVVKDSNVWRVKKAGRTTDSGMFSLKREALAKARTMREQGFDVVVHKANGQIERWEMSNGKPKTQSSKALYHKRSSTGTKVSGVTRDELKKLAPVLNRLAEYDKKGSKARKKS